jgi:hypothetical protein
MRVGAAWRALLPSLLRLTLLLMAGAARAEPAALVYAAGDIADCRGNAPRYAGAERTAALIEAALLQSPQAAVLTLGDNAYPSGRLADYTGCYGPTWGRFKAATRPVPGNHEYAGGRATGYFAYFGPAVGPGYYSFELGAWHLVALDSNLAPEAQRVQLAWLRDDLARNKAHCTLAYWHHPLYSSGGHGSIATMREAWAILYQAGAEIVLSGHDHDYERFAAQDAAGKADPARGMRQFVVGTGGAYLTPFLWRESNSEMRDNSRTGVLKLRLEADGYEWEFLEASYQGLSEPAAPADRGSGRCH